LWGDSYGGEIHLDVYRNLGAAPKGEKKIKVLSYSVSRGIYFKRRDGIYKF